MTTALSNLKNFSPYDPGGLWGDDPMKRQKGNNDLGMITDEQLAQQQEDARLSSNQSRDANDLIRRRALLSGGKGSTNPTGGLGDLSAPSLAVKSLLGM